MRGRFNGRGLLFASWMGVLAVGGGCDSVQSMLGGLEKPTARVTGVGLDSLRADGVDLLFDVEVSNPYGVALPLVNADYELASGGAAFLTGRAEALGTVPANGTRTVPLRANVSFASLLQALPAVRPGQVVPYEAKMSLSADAPGVGTIALPLSKSGQVPVPAPPAVTVEGVTVRELSLTGAAANVTLGVTNRNAFGVDLQRLGYRLALGGREVASSAVTDSVAFEPGQKQSIEVGFGLSAAELGLGLLNILRGSDAGYELSGTADLGTPFGAVSMPYSSSGTTPVTR